MKTHPTFRKLLIELVGIFFLAGCGATQNNPSESGNPNICPNGTAQIAISDTFLRELCGCQENDTAYITAPAQLSCTVPRGTRIFFHYTATKLQHQVISITPAPGDLSFTPSPVHDPSVPANGVFSHTILLETAGVYEFQDNFSSLIRGRITVLP